MSERLTYRTEDGWVGIKDQTNGVVSTNSQAVHRLADIEDVLEKYGIDTAEELDGVLKPLIENGELESWKSAVFWKMQAQKQQSRWEKLKKYAIYLKNFSIGEKKREGKCFFDGENVADDILDKMEELEKESEDE